MTPIKKVQLYSSTQNSQVRVSYPQKTVLKQSQMNHDAKMLDSSIVQPTLQKYRQSPQRVMSRPQLAHQRSVSVLQGRPNNLNHNINNHNINYQQLDTLNRRVQDALEKSR